MSERELEYRVARAIFQEQSDFPVVEDQPPLPERHFKVAISLYLAMARAAIAEVRREDKKEWSGYD